MLYNRAKLMNQISQADSLLPVPSDLPLTLRAQEIFSWLQTSKGKRS
ncbi:MAG: hypothetical protein ACK5CA_03650 [Cyanobacteriota bacterium]